MPTPATWGHSNVMLRSLRILPARYVASYVVPEGKTEEGWKVLNRRLGGCVIFLRKDVLLATGGVGDALSVGSERPGG